MTETNPAPRLLELHIEGFKSIRNQTVALQPLTVLIGANGAGKSNLIQFLSLLSRALTGGLQKWVMFQGGASEVLHFGTKVTEKIRARIEFETGKGRNFYEFALVPTMNDELVFDSERVGFQQKKTDGFYEVDLTPGAGRESAFLDAMDNHGNSRLLNASQERTVKVIHSLLRECQPYQFHDTTPLARIRQASEPHLDHFLDTNGRNLATWLFRLQRTAPLEFKRIEATVKRVFPDFGSFEIDEDPSNGKIRLGWCHSDHETRFRASHFSDGTLRFIALCALFLQPLDLMPDVILIDEPELGLHPKALTVLAAMMRSVVAQGKQVIVTTQSSSFLSEFDTASVVVVEREGEATVFKPVSDLGIPIEEWLEQYESLGALWEMNLLGGRP